MRPFYYYFALIALIAMAALFYFVPKHEILSELDIGTGTQMQVVSISTPTQPAPLFTATTTIGTATTSFSGSSEERIINITEGALRLNGSVVEAGAEFSLIAALEPLDEGYEYEYVIGPTMSVKEPGGGLCQVSTTLFRALLEAGLPITERKPHRYVVGYYGAGLDATIYGPHPDLRFINDTGYPLTIRAVVEGDEIRVDIDGLPDGRVASTSVPVEYDREEKPPIRYVPTFELAANEVFCTDKSREGIKTDATYSVTYPDGRTVDTVFHSEYQAWPGVCYVGLTVF